MAASSITPVCLEWTYVCVLVFCYAYRVHTASVEDRFNYLQHRHDIIDSVMMKQCIDDTTAPCRMAVLNQKEQVLDRYLDYLRQSELSTKDTLSRPIEDSIEDIITSSVFNILKALPKGGNMHVHENHHLSRRTVLDILWNSVDFPHLYILPANHSTRSLDMDFFLNPPSDEPWERVQGSTVYTKEYMLRSLNCIDLFKYQGHNVTTPKVNAQDSVRRWSDMGPLWRRLTLVLANVKVKVEYLESLISHGLEEGVQYWETKKSFGEKERIYEMTSDPEYMATGGKRYLEEVAGTSEMKLVRNIVERYKTETASSELPFIGFKRLVQSVRHYPQSRVHGDVNRAIDLHKQYPDVIVGFDLAGEEDTGHSILHHSEAVLRAVRYSQDTDGTFKIVCHAGETSISKHTPHRPGTEVDTMAISNLFDALALNASRIGHGLALAKHPSLLKRYISANVVIEVCPVCNQMLGYVPDLRNHPGIMYYRSGVPIILGSDGQGIFGFDFFTVDWYMVFMAWGFGLADLKQLAYQSLYHSSFDERDKDTAIQIWQLAWDKYINNTVRTICDSENNSYVIPQTWSPVDTLPITFQVHPDHIPVTMVTNDVDIHVHADSFSDAICDVLYCQFGDHAQHRARFVSSSHVICRITTSQIAQCRDVICVLPVRISYDGNTFFDTTRSITIHTS